MDNKIVVDLAHPDQLTKALETAAGLAKSGRVPARDVGIATKAPNFLAHTPSEYSEKLQAFIKQQSEKHGHQAIAKSYASHDPMTDLDNARLNAVKEVGADLAMRPSHAGEIVSRSDVSIFLVC